ncbi:MAG: L-ribulose-5-phosphate 4-epimerase [Oscillospiraceae bacterium]|nr:L-ribulose-5-phosphate 4-epimerase [Oscillospiraceae bacterium]
MEQLKRDVFDANLRLYQSGLVLFTWGNVSAIDAGRRFVVIKPSGVEYEKMKPGDMVVLNLDGSVAEGKLKPSSDTPTHLELYRRYPSIGGIVHTHSRFATVFAQAGADIPALGTTHADYFYGNIPCTGNLSAEQIRGDYEAETGRIIIDTLDNAGIDPAYVPGALVRSHGPFAWGKDADEAVYHAVVLEETANMAWHTLQLNRDVPLMQQELLDKHFLRKHGEHAYYGQ